MSDAINVSVCISGFRQSSGQSHGMFRLAEALIADGHSHGTRARVWLKPWNSRWDQVAADLIHLRDLHRCELKIAVYAYSWGAGWGAMQLAHRLMLRGVEVPAMVLSDPVYRGRWLIQRWRNLFGRRAHTLLGKVIGEPLIRVPANVRQVWSFYQENNWPQGHRIVPTNGTIIEPPIRVHHAVHESMDESAAFHRHCRAIADELRADPPPTELGIFPAA